jgi:putative heme-binding domain-containing protein
MASEALAQTKRAERRAERATEAKKDGKDAPAADGKKKDDKPADAKPETKKTGSSDVVAATPVEKIKLLPGFKAELLYSVPAEQQGSWVSMCVDNKGRLITSDQYGKLYRTTISGAGVSPVEVKVEPIAESLNIGMAQGLLYAFDSLYVMVNGPKKKEAGLQGSGLFRVQDTDGDDQFDKLTQLLDYNGPGGEHGPHAVVLSPDGKSLYLAAGNHTEVPKLDSSLVPQNWGEDFLLTRLWDANGHARNRMAPGGFILRTDPEGKKFEMFSAGYRNQYDMAFNPDGELFTYDSDMEWDIGSPWYRPTRVNHVTAGSDFGWRSGTSNPPADFTDSLGSVVDIGPGSPTGVAFGTGAKFPEKYQRALFISDWSYGTIYAVHLTPDGSTYSGEAEKFALAQPLPVTDMVVHPQDGAMYVTIGGRKTQSGLYRITYTGAESTAPAPKLADDDGLELRELRYSLERLLGAESRYTVDLVWPYLGHPDRVIRFTARQALEHQPVDGWAERALAETDPVASMQAILALARNGKPEHQARAIESLNRIDWASLGDSHRLDLLRTYQLVFIRLGKGTDATRKSVLAKFDGLYPNKSSRLNLELVKQLVYLEAPGVVKRTLDLLAKAPTQEDQIAYVFALMDFKADWTLDDRRAYFTWFNNLASSRGGHSFIGFIKNIRQGAIDSLSEQEKAALKDVIEVKFAAAEIGSSAPVRPLVQKWKVDDLVADVDAKLEHRDFEKGRALFSAANCFKCHRVKLEGGSTGPDLSSVAGRFSNRNLLESIIEPSKVISDQYEKMQFQMLDGRVIEGRVINLNGDNLMVLTNMLDPDSIAGVKRSEVEVSQVSKTSMMPEGLLDTLTKDEILDLMAYMKSGGNPQSALFSTSAGGK